MNIFDAFAWGAVMGLGIGVFLLGATTLILGSLWGLAFMAVGAAIAGIAFKKGV